MKKISRKGRPLFKSSAAPRESPGNGPASASTVSSSSSGSGGILRRTTWADKIRDKLPPLEENEYEVLWERGVLGVIFLESERDGIPYVSKATETCISPEVQPGDTLKFVNIVRSKDHSFSDFFKILATMKKPVLLRFERANAGTPTSDDDVARPGFDQRSSSSSSLNSGSSVESPHSKFQRANSVPPNEQKPPKSQSRGAFWRSSTARDSTIPPPEPTSNGAAPPRDAEDGVYRIERNNAISPQQAPNGTSRPLVQPPPGYFDYDVLWETGSLGLFFGEDRTTNLPVVTRSTSSANAVVQRMVAVNDTLVSANGIQSRDYTFDAFFSRLQQMNKPVRLVFRRLATSPGKVPPGRKPSMTVETNLSPGGSNLRRPVGAGESPHAKRSNTPPLPPSPQVNGTSPSQAHHDRGRTPSPPSVSVPSVSPSAGRTETPSTSESAPLRHSVRASGGSRTWKSSSSEVAAAVETVVPGRNSQSPLNGTASIRSSVKVPENDPEAPQDVGDRSSHVKRGSMGTTPSLMKSGSNRGLGTSPQNAEIPVATVRENSETRRNQFEISSEDSNSRDQAPQPEQKDTNIKADLTDPWSEASESQSPPSPYQDRQSEKAPEEPSSMDSPVHRRSSGTKMDADNSGDEIHVEVSGSGSSSPLLLSPTTSLSPPADDAPIGFDADVEEGIAVDAVGHSSDDDFELNAFAEVRDKPLSVDIGSPKHATVVEVSDAVISDEVNSDDEDEDDRIDIDMNDIKSDMEGNDDLDVKTDDPSDDDAAPLDPLVSDPDISSDIDLVASEMVLEPAKTKDGVQPPSKVNKSALNANLAKYKKKGKTARGVTKLPALGEAEALTVPLVAPNAVNTTVQVRGRPKPKQTMMDTPDSTTYLVKWKENRSIGLQLKEVRFAKGTFPLVTDVCQEPCCESLKHICIGDVIVEINGKNTSSMGVKKTVNFLKSCTKTTLMKLRHGPGYASQRVSAYV